MDQQKFCFLNHQRPCDLTCRAAFPTDDPLDPVGCVYVWVAQTAGEASESVRDTLDQQLDRDDRHKGPNLN